MVKDKPVPNVYPIIYSPTYVTDQYETYGQNKSSDANNDCYWGTDWMPDAKDRAKAASVLNHAYHLLGDIVLLVNNGGTLEERPLK
jgi:hypothetical protein